MPNTTYVEFVEGTEDPYLKAYRKSECWTEYEQIITDQGLDMDIAHEVWQELQWKYANMDK